MCQLAEFERDDGRTLVRDVAADVQRETVNYGNDAEGVYATLFDAYVASRRGKISKDDYCAFQMSIAQHYTSLGTSSDPQARNQWVQFFTDQRAKAISWRSAVDPTLRSG